jgi:hypothetical protein
VDAVFFSQHPGSSIEHLGLSLTTSGEQLSDAVNQPLYGKRFDQVLHVMRGEEEGDFGVSGEAGNKDETI